MKKIFGLALIAILGISAPAFAQSKVEKGAKKAWHGTKKGAKAAGNKTAEVASRGAARVHDKKSDEWVGPNNQTIYVDDDSKYYWINKRGKRIFVNETELKAKSQ